MKNPIEKRLNIALDAEDWQTLNEYMEVERINQTQAIRQLLRDWKKRHEIAEKVKNTSDHLTKRWQEAPIEEAFAGWVDREETNQ